MCFAEHKSAVIRLHYQVGGGRILGSGSSDGCVKLWESRTPRSVVTIEPQRANGELSAFVLHPHAPVFAVGSRSRVVQVYNTAGDELSTIRYHVGFVGQRLGPVASLAFHPYRVRIALRSRSARPFRSGCSSRCGDGAAGTACCGYARFYVGSVPVGLYTNLTARPGARLSRYCLMQPAFTRWYNEARPWWCIMCRGRQGRLSQVPTPARVVERQVGSLCRFLGPRARLPFGAARRFIGISAAMVARQLVAGAGRAGRGDFELGV